ncbi:hypothetical protein MHH67_11365 [Bacillus sp. FSL K6-0047]
MTKAICVDAGSSTVLEKGKEYFVFPNGSNHFYVAKSNNPKAHFGCFQQELFQLALPEVEQLKLF